MDENEVFRYWNLTARDLIGIYDEVPHQPGFLRSLDFTTFTPVSTTTVKVYQNDHRELSLIETTERGGPIPQDLRDGANVRVLPTFRLAKGATVRSHEMQDVVRLGPQSDSAIRERVGADMQRRLTRIDQEMSFTEEHMLMGLIQGVMPDADGRILLDSYAEFGTAPPAALTFDFANWDNAAFRRFANDLKRSMVRSTNGLPSAGRAIALCGDEFYDSLVTSAAVRELYLGHAGARELENMGQAFEMFPFAGVEWWNYRGTDDMATLAIPDNDVRMFPAGVPGLFLDVRAPFEDLDAVNTQGQTRYPIQVVDRDRNFWIKNELYTYPSYICTRPGALRKGSLA